MLNISSLYLHQELIMKNNTFILVIFIALYFFTQQSYASSQLCQANENDCTFVLLSEKHQRQVNKVISDVSQDEINDHVTQSTSITQSSEIMLIINNTRAKTEVSPFSTFKIPNSLIAFDSGQVQSTQQVLDYDKKKYPPQSWWPSSWNKQNHTIASAFKVSMVPIYREIASKVGENKMQSYLSNFEYGNEDISSGLDDFWLDGSMKISAIEQVRFLQRMHQGHLAVDPLTIKQLKEIMLVEKTDRYAFYAKTGTGSTVLELDGKKAILGWYIGFVENTEGVHYFALNISRSTYQEINAIRKKIVRNHLLKAGVI